MVKPNVLKVVWDVEALNQFKEVLTYLEGQSEQAPKIVKQAILDRIKVLVKNPFSCELDKLREPSSEEFRAFVAFSYRITYQIQLESNEIRILRVRHTSREPLGY